MARIIFIFPIILVYFLTIVSKNAFGRYSDESTDSGISEIRTGNDVPVPIFKDDFEDGIFPGWEPAESWEVSSTDKISGVYSLKHSTLATGNSSSLFHAIRADLNSFDVEWSFKIKNGNWDPSSSNRFWFYLSADTIQTDKLNGWAAGVNISGSSDLLQLWRIRNGKTDSLIVQSDLDWNASTLAAITVKRTSRGIWNLSYQLPGEPDPKTFSGNDRTVSAFHNLGLSFNYTSTRAGQLWIDDIVVNLLPSELYIQKLLLINTHTLSLTFNKPVNPGSIHSGNFKMTDENQLNIAINQVSATNGSDRSVEVSFGKVPGTELILSVSGIADLSGETMNPEQKSITYAFTPENGSILLSEILFNPFSGGVDFVELVNVSEQTVPVNRLKLAGRNDTMALKQIYPIASKKRFLKPGQFLVCTKDSAILANQYFGHNPESFCVMKILPSFPDDAGTVVLLNDSLEVLDEFSYSAKMHSPFLADENGVSLERISLDIPTNDRGNWASAAASVGFATPGLPNSQTESGTEIQDEIIPEPKAFSPNGDGYNDQLTIGYRFSKPGYISNVRIFDAVGRQVKFLVKNESLGQDGNWIWDGKGDAGQKLNIGVYIILVEVFDQAGHTKAFKKACTLTDRLN